MNSMTCELAVEQIMGVKKFDKISLGDESDFQDYFDIVDEAVFLFVGHLSEQDRLEVWNTCDDSFKLETQSSMGASENGMLEIYVNRVLFLAIKQRILRNSGINV